MPRRPLFFLVVGLLAVAVTAGAQPAAKAKSAVITLEKGGEIAIEFFPADAPKTVENFLKLAGQGFYDGTTFHRVEPGFVVQGGDPLSKTLPAVDRRLGTGKRLLEVGCGSGAHLEHYCRDNDVVAMDVDQPALEVVRERLGVQTV